MIGYPIVFRCSECTVEEPNLEHLESHIWSRHFQKFPFNCSICDFPSINAANLIEHFRQLHPEQELVEFRRNLEDEKRLRKIVAESIAVQIFDEETQENVVPAPTNETITLAENQQIVMLPREEEEEVEAYEEIVEQSQSDEDEFGLLEDDENVDELIEDDDGNLIDSMGNPIYMSGHQNVDRIHFIETNLEEDDEDLHSSASNNFQIKLLRQRRLEKTINDVASEGCIATTSQTIITDVGTSQNSTKSVVVTNHQQKSFENSGGRGSLRCEICGKRFKFASKFNEHKRIHVGDRPFPCEYCPARFTQKGQLTVHLRRHTGETPYQCQWECGKSFISTSARRLHEKSHSGERSFACSFCGRTFSKNSHCVRHVKNLHNHRLIPQQQNEIRLIDGLIEHNSNRYEEHDELRLHNLVDDVVEAVREEKYMTSRFPVLIEEQS